MDEVQIEAIDGVLTITLARPARRNALTAAMYAALADTLQGTEADDAVRAVVIAGSDGAFTRGNDLDDFLAHPPADAQAPVFRFLRALAVMDTPVLAAVDGPAVGVGTTLLLHCDLVYATPRARFRLPFVDLGLVPEAASSLLLPRLVGHQRAAELLLLGEGFDAEAACRWGLVNAVVPEAELSGHVADRARALAAKPAEAVRLAKRLLRGGDRPAVLDRMEEEGRHFAARLHSWEFREAVAAFRERRAPAFGRGPA